MGTLDCKNQIQAYITNKNFNHFPNMENSYDPFFHPEKAALKKTILQQDAIFRRQVSELHRLYRKQRDLMEEQKAKRSRKIRRRMLDLELPAEVYLDFDDVEDSTFADPRERKYDPGPERCLGLSLSTRQNFHSEDLNKPLEHGSSAEFLFLENNFRHVREEQGSVAVGRSFLQANSGKSTGHGNSLTLDVGPPPEPVGSRGFSLFRENPLILSSVDYCKAPLAAAPTCCVEVNATFSFDGSALPSFGIDAHFRQEPCPLNCSNYNQESTLVNGNGSEVLTFMKPSVVLNSEDGGADQKLDGEKFHREVEDISSEEEITDAVPFYRRKLLVDSNSKTTILSQQRYVADIDLEANRLEEQESVFRVQSRKEDENQAETRGNDIEATAAAEKLLAISQIQNSLRLSPSPPDALRWFADVVTAEESGQADMDYFERAALDLKETNFKEFSPPKTVEAVKSNEGESASQHVQMSRAKNGGQSRRNFQREILPSLASLSRQEVAEDLQLIGWLAERRRHRHRRGGAVIENSEETAAGEKNSLLGWGRRTKRCRRRYPRQRA